MPKQYWAGVEYFCPSCLKDSEDFVQAQDFLTKIETSYFECSKCFEKFLILREMAKGNLKFKVFESD